MNILTQCCGMILLFVMMYFYKTQKNIQLHTGQAFLGIWYSTFICLFLDILSLVVLKYRAQLPSLLVLFVCKAYISSLVWQGIFAVIYVCADIYDNNDSYSKIRLRFHIFGTAMTLAIFSLPLYIHAESASDTYTYGPAATLTYVFALSMMSLLSFMVYRHRHQINPNRRRAMWVWIIVWILAAAIQFFDKALLLVGYASALSVMIIYLKLENPEANLDRQSGLFNQTAFLLYAKQLLNQKEDFFLLGMSYSMRVMENLSNDLEHSIGMEMVQFISGIPDTTAFCLEDNTVVFVFSNAKSRDSAYLSLIKRFEEPWGSSGIQRITPHWYYVEDARIVQDAREYLSLFQYARQLERDYIPINQEMVNTLSQEQVVEKMLIDAIKENRVEVFYQPIYSTHVDFFTSAEALVRIRDTDGSLIPPSTFIEVAERTGLIMKLGETVFEKVCEFIREHNPLQYGIEYIEVNLSIIQCGYEYLAASYKRIMQEYGIPPNAINLEITETASLNEKRTLLENMEELREYGVTFSLDDFGTGQSNLNYIVDMPVDIVKFDRDMTQSYFANDKARYVMDAAMHMIHGLNLKIVSEGVENREQYDVMDQLGINYIQGYYFSKPLPSDEFLAFIQKNNPTRRP